MELTLINPFRYVTLKSAEAFSQELKSSGVCEELAFGSGHEKTSEIRFGTLCSSDVVASRKCTGGSCIVMVVGFGIV